MILVLRIPCSAPLFRKSKGVYASVHIKKIINSRFWLNKLHKAVCISAHEGIRKSDLHANNDFFTITRAHPPNWQSYPMPQNPDIGKVGK
jgi:hypothetical protein